MTDEASPLAVPVHARVRAGLRRSGNWLELVRFAVVGGSGYVVNLAVFTTLVHAAGLGYLTAATGAFVVAVTNNFAWNRLWTFKAHRGPAHHQAARFLVVSLTGFAFNLVVLSLLVSSASLPEVPAQALAIALATPLTFLGNKLWTFDA